MMGSFPAAATFWTVYESTKSALKQALPATRADGAPTNSYTLPLIHAAAAGAADVAVCLVRNPFEVVKQQMQAGLHKSTGAAFSSILKSSGVRGFYVGYGSTVLREIPFDAIEFVLYENMKARREAHVARECVLWENAALGSIAGGFAAAVTTPLDVIKTRLMTQTKHQSVTRYTGWSHALRTIVAEEGARALFSGIKPRVLWISLGGAIFIGSFEELQRLAAPSKKPASHAPHADI